VENCRHPTFTVRCNDSSAKKGFRCAGCNAPWLSPAHAETISSPIALDDQPFGAESSHVRGFSQ
jgi:hypothetical protein